MLRNPLIFVVIVLMVTACGGRPTPTSPSAGDPSAGLQSSQVSKDDQSSASNSQEIAVGQEVTIEDLGISELLDVPADKRSRMIDSLQYHRFRLTNRTPSYRGTRAYMRCRDADGVLAREAEILAVIPPNRSLVLFEKAYDSDSNCSSILDHATDWDAYVEPVSVVKTELKEDKLEFVVENPGPNDFDSYWAFITVQGYDKDGNVLLSDVETSRVNLPAGERGRSSVELGQLTYGSIIYPPKPEVTRYEVIFVVLNQKNIGP